MQQITDLKKENFSLKLRIYFLEERMLQKYGDGEDVFKTVSICRDLVSLWHVLKSPLLFFFFFFFFAPGEEEKIWHFCCWKVMPYGNRTLDEIVLKLKH